MSADGHNDKVLNSEAAAKSRFIILNVVRLSGAILIALGLGIIANGFMDLPVEAGYTAFAIGVFEFVVLPILLSRKWKSPTKE
jgi:hypothetical protein